MKAPGSLALDLALAAAIAAALASLPPEVVPWSWLLGYALPALGLCFYQRRAQGLAVGAALLAAAALIGIGSALRAYVPASDITPLACVLVAPLAYFAARRAPPDRRYALFLAVCLLVIGSVLDAPRARVCAPLFMLAAAATLLLENGYAARHQRVAVRTAAAGWRSRSARGIAVVGLCGLAALSMFHLLAAIPPPSRTLPQAGPSADRAEQTRQGLSDSFDLGRSDGWLDTVRDLQAPQLARVRALDGDTPDDLYLRFTHFDLAGANRWSTAKYLVQSQPPGDAWTLRRPRSDLVARFEIERMPLANGHLLLPAYTWHVENVVGLEGSAEAALLREATPSATPLRYIAHVAPPDGAFDAPYDPRAMHLLALPGDLALDDVLALARSYLGPNDATPLRRAAAVAEGLKRNYQYSRQDPTGPHPDTLHNFLFHSRRGYCMHFASALAVMLRGLRIPCRIGAGLYGGRPDPEREGWRRYGDADAHAWVEVPLLGVGWVVIDPTPGEVRGARSREADAARDASNPGGAPNADPAADNPSATAGARRPTLRLAAVVLLSLLASPFLRRTPTPQTIDSDALPSAHPARRALLEILRTLERHGLRRQRGETLARLASRAEDALEFDRAALADALAAYEELRFGGRAFDAERAARMREGLRALQAARATAPADQPA